MHFEKFMNKAGEASYPKSALTPAKSTGGGAGGAAVSSPSYPACCGSLTAGINKSDFSTQAVNEPTVSPEVGCKIL